MRLTPPVWRPAAASLRVQQRLPLGGGAAAALAATTGTTRLAPGCIDAELEAFHADFTLSHAASVLMASLETPAGLESEYVLPKQRRTGLFSATMTTSVADLVRAGLRNPLSTPAWAIDATILELKRRGVACPETSSWDEDMCTAGEMMALGRGLFGRVAPARAGAAVGAAARDNTRVRIT